MNIRDIASQQIDFDRIEQMLAEGKQPHVKLGIDATSHSLHLGHMVPIMALKSLVDNGCRATIIIGMVTANIGDPTGKDKQRPVLDMVTIDGNAFLIEQQIKKIFADTDDVEIVKNLDIAPDRGELIGLMSIITVNEMSGMRHFKNRMEEGKPIHLAEFAYPLLQACDSVRLKPDLELGGNDQLANCTLTRNIMSRCDQTPEAVMLFPILLGTDGKKMSKSEDNHVSLSMSPEEVFGRTMSISDELAENWISLLFHTKPETEDKLETKRALAFLVTELVHDTDQAAEAIDEFDKKFRDKIVDPEDVITIPTGLGIIEAVRQTGFVSSNRQARELILAGAIRINQEKVTSTEATIEQDCILQKGKRRAMALKVQ